MGGRGGSICRALAFIVIIFFSTRLKSRRGNDDDGVSSAPIMMCVFLFERARLEWHGRSLVKKIKERRERTSEKDKRVVKPIRRGQSSKVGKWRAV